MTETKIKFEEPTRRDWVIGILSLVTFVIVIGVGAFLLIPENWAWWLLLVLGGTLLLAFNQNRKYGCRCRRCEHEFKISYFLNLISPHGVDGSGSWLWTKCPSCETRGKVTVIRAVRDRSAAGNPPNPS